MYHWNGSHEISSSCIRRIRTIESTHNTSQPTLQQYRLSLPSQRTLPKRRLERFVDRPDETELHLPSYFGGNVMLNVFPVCPRKNDLANLCPVGTEDFHPNPPNRRDAPAKRHLPRKIRRQIDMRMGSVKLTSPVIATSLETVAPLNSDTKAHV